MSYGQDDMKTITITITAEANSQQSDVAEARDEIAATVDVVAGAGRDAVKAISEFATVTGATARIEARSANHVPVVVRDLLAPVQTPTT